MCAVERKLRVSVVLSANALLLSFFFNDPATTEIYTLSLHDALPISGRGAPQHDRLRQRAAAGRAADQPARVRSEEHTSELQSQFHLVCRLLLEKKKRHNKYNSTSLQCTHVKLRSTLPRFVQNQPNL